MGVSLILYYVNRLRGRVLIWGSSFRFSFDFLKFAFWFWPIHSSTWYHITKPICQNQAQSENNSWEIEFSADRRIQVATKGGRAEEQLIKPRNLEWAFSGSSDTIRSAVSGNPK